MPMPTAEQSRDALQAKIMAALKTMDPELGDMPTMVRHISEVLDVWQPPNPLQFTLALVDSYERNAQRIRKALMEIAP